MNWELSESDLHEVMVLNKCSTVLLHQLIGLMYASTSIASAIILLEQTLANDPTLATLLQRNGASIISELIPVIKQRLCDQGEFCKKRKGLQLGDLRHVFEFLWVQLMPHVADHLKTNNRSLIVVICVAISRLSLSRVCDCVN